MAGYSFDLSGRVALVTGASSGLGARFARLLAASGAAVVLVARRTGPMQALVADIEASGGRALAVAADVTDEASLVAAYDAAEATLGPVDTVIANAGLNVEGPALDLAAAAFARVVDVNLTGVFLTVREGARRMMAAGSQQRDHGRIVIISSITATDVTPGLAAYSASKAGVLQLGRVLARDWSRHGINLNILCPGYIETDLNADWFGTEGGQRQINRWPRRRLMQADALDASLLHLCSDTSQFITGSVVTVDDGQSLSS